MYRIREADRIAVLKGGEVVETGTFDALLKSKGGLHNLMEQQIIESSTLCIIFDVNAHAFKEFIKLRCPLNKQ